MKCIHMYVWQEGKKERLLMYSKGETHASALFK